MFVPLRILFLLSFIALVTAYSAIAQTEDQIVPNNTLVEAICEVDYSKTVVLGQGSYGAEVNCRHIARETEEVVEFSAFGTELSSDVIWLEESGSFAFELIAEADPKTILHVLSQLIPINFGIWRFEPKNQDKW